MFCRTKRHRSKRRGASLVLIALLMTAVIAMAAFAVEMGRMYLVRAQLQTAVDSGALAAAIQMKQNPGNLPLAELAAKEYVQRNRVGWAITVEEEAIQINTGTWDLDTSEFTVGGDEPNAVRVMAAQREERLLLGGILGRRTFSIPRQAIAASDTTQFDIMMVLDLSGSMADLGRIEALHDAAPVFVDVIEQYGGDDRIGVMGYGARIGYYNPVAQGHSGTLYLSAPNSLNYYGSDWIGVLEYGLTDDFDYLRETVLGDDNLLAGKYDNYTPIGDSIRDSVHYLSVNGRGTAKRILVLMSDGLANRPNGHGPQYARDMADYAATQNMKIYTITLGDEGDEDLMQEIAEKTGAEYFAASGDDLSAALRSAFENVANDIKRTQLVK
jgi:Ca-activated chloride channel homolog